MSDVIGIQAVRAALRGDSQRARCLYVARGRRDARMNELISMAKDAGVRFQLVEAAWFRRRAGDVAHQGVLLESHAHEMLSEDDLFGDWAALPADPLLLVLDGITDPRNFGACLRTANGAGVDAVIVPKRKSAPLSPVALKTAQGGVEDLRIVEVTNLARTLAALQARNVWIVGADGDAPGDYTRVDYTGPMAIVMGSEGKGLRRLTREHCDVLVNIPMHGSVSSLNVSVATGILLFEARRVRAAASSGGSGDTEGFRGIEKGAPDT